MIRVLVTGSRDWRDVERLEKVLNKIHERVNGRMVVVHGKCPSGADALADEWALTHGVGREHYPADWKTYGKAAGFRRNKQMVLTHPDMCVAFIGICKDDKCKRLEIHGSHGATDCAKKARQYQIRCWVYKDGFE